MLGLLVRNRYLQLGTLKKVELVEEVIYLVEFQRMNTLK